MFVGSAALADSEAELGNDIRIENVAVTPVGAAGASRLTFNIINDSSASLHLARVSASIWKDARLMVSIGPGAARDIGSIGIAEGTALDLRSSHIWFEVYPRKGLVPGETFEAVFDFVTFRVAVPVHVHSGGQILQPTSRSQAGTPNASEG